MTPDEFEELDGILADIEVLRIDLFDAEKMDCQFAADAEKIFHRLQRLVQRPELPGVALTRRSLEMFKRDKGIEEQS